MVRLLFTVTPFSCSFFWWCYSWPFLHPLFAFFLNNFAVIRAEFLRISNNFKDTTLDSPFHIVELFCFFFFTYHQFNFLEKSNKKSRNFHGVWLDFQSTDNHQFPFYYVKPVTICSAFKKLQKIWSALNYCAVLYLMLDWV